MSVTYNTLPAPFVTTVQQTAIAISYNNPAFIADAVMPRVDVDAPAFYYTQYNKSDMFTLPAEGIEISRKGSVPEVDFSATEASAVVKDYALDEVVPRRDQLAAAGKRINPLNKATEQVTGLVDLAREVRVSGTIFNLASYNSANRVTLSGTSQWSDTTNSDPVAALTDAMDGMLVRPTQLVLGHLVSTALRRHPKVLKAYNGNLGDTGMVPLAFLQEILEIDEIVVGRSLWNSARKGQTSNLTRLWGKHAALLYKNPLASTTEDMTFAITAQWGTRIAGNYFDEKKGMRGSDVVRSGESVKELVLANDLGFFFQNVIA